MLCLEAVALLLIRNGSHAKAAHLFGATDALRQAIATPRTHDSGEQCRASLATCGDAQGEAAAATAFAEGLASASAQAIADAFAWIDHPVA